MGAEHPDHETLPARIADPHVGMGRVVIVVVGVVHASALQFPESVGEVERFTGDPGTGLVRQILAVPGDGQLEYESGDGGEDRTQNRYHQHDRIVVPVAVAGTEHGPVKEHTGRVGQDGHHAGCDGHDQYVPVLDMGHLVADDAFQLVVAEYPEDPSGGHDGGVLGIPPGGECVRHRYLADPHLRHGQTRLVGDLLHDAVEFRLLLTCDQMDTVRGESTLLREEV